LELSIYTLHKVILPDTTKFVEISDPPHIMLKLLLLDFRYTPTFQGADPYLASMPLRINAWFGIYGRPQSKTVF